MKKSKRAKLEAAGWAVGSVQDFPGLSDDDFDREIELARGNKALMRLLDARARQSQALSLGTVKAQLGVGAEHRRPSRRRA